jgi:integrase/recombinase XerD
MGGAMQIKLKHVIEDVDRHGNVRIYVRVPGRPKVRIRAWPGTEEFMTAYRAAIGNDAHRPPQAQEAKRGSFSVLVHSLL